MKMKFSLPLAAATLLLTGAPLFAQMTGTSHPEDMDDTRQLAPDASDSHYIAIALDGCGNGYGDHARVFDPGLDSAQPAHADGLRQEHGSGGRS